MLDVAHFERAVHIKIVVGKHERFLFELLLQVAQRLFVPLNLLQIAFTRHHFDDLVR